MRLYDFCSMKFIRVAAAFAHLKILPLDFSP